MMWRLLAQIRRTAGIYGAMAGIIPKIFLTYRAWFWVGIVLNVIQMTIYVFFWRAVYAGTDSIAGMELQQTLNYILLAQVFGPLADLFLLYEFGYGMREGGIAIALLRPVDLQGSFYAQSFTRLAVDMVWQIPMALVATLFFGLQWPTDPAVWGAFLVAVFLGRTVIFFFDWLLACFTFYTTEVWGLSVMILGLSLFLSGGLVPLVMMPGWLQTVVQSFPFAQALYAPLSILTGITPLEQAPRLWLTQFVWLCGLFIVSRLFFSVAVRKVTVQGG